MTILITGASGFIAGHLASMLLQDGHLFYLQSRSARRLSHYPSNTLIEKSFSSLVPSDLPNLSAIIHLASAGVSPQLASWSVLHEVNISGTVAICELASLMNVPILIAGSSSEYGLSAQNFIPIPPDAPLRPTYPYAISKAISSSLALSYSRFENLELGYLRIFNAFGPGQNPSNLWPSLVSAAVAGRDFDLTPGEQIRDFVPVNIVVDQIIDVLFSSKLRRGSPYVANIATGISQSTKEFCQKEWDKYSSGGQLKIGSLPYRTDEVMNYTPCILPMYL